jgi:hypothetical protein
LLLVAGFSAFSPLPTTARTLTDAELAAIFGSSDTGCPGCELEATATDCSLADEPCNSCTNSMAPGNPNAHTCPTKFKVYLGVAKKRCKSNPPSNNKECIEGMITCWSEHFCHRSGLLEDNKCDGGTPNRCTTAGATNWWCRDCSDGGLTGIDKDEEDDACQDCGE